MNILQEEEVLIRGKLLRHESLSIRTVVVSSILSSPQKTKLHMDPTILVSPIKYMKIEKAESSFGLEQRVNELITSRGYRIQNYETLNSGYFTRPTKYEKASYGHFVYNLVVNQRDCDAYEKLLIVGLAPNPFNATNGEYLVHIVCQHAKYDILEIMIKYGGREVIQVADVYGRTPLHYLCNCSESLNFDIKQTLMILCEHDRQLLHMTDCFNKEPLSYVNKVNTTEWKIFFESIIDTYWPLEHVDDDLDLTRATASPNTYQSIPIHHESYRIITSEILTMLASGCMESEEVESLQYKYYCQSRTRDNQSRNIATICETDDFLLQSEACSPLPSRSFMRRGSNLSLQVEVTSPETPTDSNLLTAFEYDDDPSLYSFGDHADGATGEDDDCSLDGSELNDLLDVVEQHMNSKPKKFPTTPTLLESKVQTKNKPSYYDCVYASYG